MDSQSPTPNAVRQLIVIGLGLIGGSLAKAAKQRGICTKVIGIARRDQVCEQAIELGVVDHATTQLEDLVPSMAEGDVIFIAVPTLSVRKILQQVAACVPSSVTVTDGASVKGSVLADVQAVYGCIPPQVVLGHPIAGSEKSGVEAANPELYIKHRIILTPTAETDPVHLARVTNLWQAVGAEVLHLTVADHDEILGATSHLPHAIAFSLVDTLAHDSQNENIFRYAAGGFRDFTRIASSDAVMWRDIMLANDKAVMQAIDLFSDNLARLRNAIEEGDGQQLLGIFTRAKAARDHFSAMLARRAYLNKERLPETHFQVRRSQEVKGEVCLPGDKSISHRAVMLAAIAEGTSEIEGFMEGEDAFATLQAFRDMGVVIEGPDEGRVRVHGVGLHGLKAPIGPIYVGNAGTALRLLSGLLAGQAFDSEITTDALLSEVSLQPVIQPLEAMGAGFVLGDEFRPPIFVHGGRLLKGVNHQIAVASAQVKSSILVAALYAEGKTRLREPSQTRDHTERLLGAFGCNLHREGEWLVLDPGQHLRGCQIEIPGDFSSAVVLIAAAGLAEQADLRLKAVGVNPTRTAALSILRGFGLSIDVQNRPLQTAELAADILVQGSNHSLVAQVIPAEAIVTARDELPVLLVIASLAQGVSEFQGVVTSRLSHSKRFRRMIDNLSLLGVKAHISNDSLFVKGGQIVGGTVDADNDHRMALALALMGLNCAEAVTVKNCAAVEAAFPHFVQLAKRLGISIETIGR